jgi:hypothetical protein
MLNPQVFPSRFFCVRMITVKVADRIAAGVSVFGFQDPEQFFCQLKILT